MQLPIVRNAVVVCLVVGIVIAGAGRAHAQSTVPSPWSSQDIGAPAVSGSSSYDQSTGSFTVHAAGTDIWGTADQFHFVYQTLTGDGTITARVDSLSYADAWSKAGVMIRSSLSADAAHGFALVSAG